MGRINNIELYNLDNLLTGEEILIGSDFDGKTKNYKLDDIMQYISATLEDAEFVGLRVVVVENYEALRTYTPLFENSTAVVLGHTTPLDGAGGIFTLKTSSLTENGGTILNSASPTARWFRNYDNSVVNVKWFGAKGDYVYSGSSWSGSDDTLPFEKAISTGKSVFVPEGSYQINSNTLTEPTLDSYRGLRLESNTTFIGEGYERTVIVMTNVVNGEIETYFGVLNIINKTDIRIEGIHFRGDGDTYEELSTFDYPSQGVHIFGTSVKNITVEKCMFTYILGHGIQDNSEESYNVYLYNKASYNSQNGLNINTKHAIINGNEGSYNGFGLIEAACGNSTVTNNKAYYNKVSGITVGGYNAEDNQGFGDNNYIGGNICAYNERKGLGISRGVRKSIITDNISYNNGIIGISLNDDHTINSRNTVVNNIVYNNGILGSPDVGIGIFVDSKNNYLIGNRIYNTGVITDQYCQRFGVSVASGCDYQYIADNLNEGHTNFEYEFIGVKNITFIGCGNEKVNSVGESGFKTNSRIDVIAYNSYPMQPWFDYFRADNVISSKSAILPKAANYPKGKVMVIYDEGYAASNFISISPYGSETINGSNSPIVMSNNYEVLKLVSNGSNGWIIL